MKKIILILLTLMSAIVILNAQSGKVAYINSSRIMTESSDTREAQRLFQLERENWDREIQDLENELQSLERAYESTSLMLRSEDKRKEEETKIQNKQKEYRQLIESIYGENGIAERRNSELLRPIMEKIQSVIEKIAIEENYTMIFDASSSGIIWAQERLDITQQVIIEMNRVGRTN
jgi:outer membrane protein